MQIKKNNEIPLCTSIKTIKSGTLTTSNAGEDMEQEESSSVTRGNTKLYSHFGKQYFITKLNTLL